MLPNDNVSMSVTP